MLCLTWYTDYLMISGYPWYVILGVYTAVKRYSREASFSAATALWQKGMQAQQPRRSELSSLLHLFYQRCIIVPADWHHPQQGYPACTQPSEYGSVKLLHEE